MRPLAIALAAATLAAGPAPGAGTDPAPAEPPPDLVVVASLSDRLWAAGIPEAMRRRGVRVVLTEDAAAWARLDRCVERACWRAVMDGHHARAVALVSVHEEGDDYVAQSRWYSAGRFLPERYERRTPTEYGDAPVFDALYEHWLKMLREDAT